MLWTNLPTSSRKRQAQIESAAYGWKHAGLPVVHQRTRTKSTPECACVVAPAEERAGFATMLYAAVDGQPLVQSGEICGEFLGHC